MVILVNKIQLIDIFKTNKMGKNWIIGVIAAIFAIILIVAIASALPYPLGLIIGLVAVGGVIYYVVKKKGMMTKGRDGYASGTKGAFI